MDTWMEDEYPWLIEEKRKIKEFVIDLKKPFLGFCLGCQLLGEVAGGKVVKSSPPEIGILNIDLLKESKSDNLFHNFPNTLSCRFWVHFGPQLGAEIVAKSTKKSIPT